MANKTIPEFPAVVTPAVTDLHVVDQGGVTKKETTDQIRTPSQTVPLLVGNTTDSTSKDTGSIITEGGIGAEKNIINGGYLKSGKGRWPTGSKEGTGITDNSIFDELSPYIPNTNDEILITGALSDTNDMYLYILNRAKRWSSTQIVFYGLQMTISSGSLVSTSLTVTDGSSTVRDISISW